MRVGYSVRVARSRGSRSPGLQADGRMGDVRMHWAVV